MASPNTKKLMAERLALRMGASERKAEDPSDMSRPARRRRLAAERKAAKKRV